MNECEGMMVHTCAAGVRAVGVAAGADLGAAGTIALAETFRSAAMCGGVRSGCRGVPKSPAANSATLQNPVRRHTSKLVSNANQIKLQSFGMTRHSMAQEFLLMQSKHESPNYGFRPMKEAQCVCKFLYIPALHDLLGCPIKRLFSY